MLKFKDESGRTVGVLEDEDAEPKGEMMKPRPVSEKPKSEDEETKEDA